MTSTPRAVLRSLLIGGLQLVAPSAVWANAKPAPQAQPHVAPPATPKGGPTKGGAMVAIPGGKFWMGADMSGSVLGVETPRHEVTLAPFQMDVTPVTVAAYRACSDDGTCPAAVSGRPYGAGGTSVQCNSDTTDGSRDRHPVNCVSQADADTFCKWAGKRLPTEEEWEYVAKGGSENRKFPWGNTSPFRDMGIANGWVAPLEGSKHACLGRRLASTRDTFNTCPVGSFPEANGRWGIEDLVGNVQEWTSGELSSGYGATGQPNPGIERTCWVFRGSSGSAGANGQQSEADALKDIRITYRHQSIYCGHDASKPDSVPGDIMPNIGFRCVK